MKYFYVYMVRCNDCSVYVGLTNHLTRRINEHNKSDNTTSYTYKRRPVKLIFFQEFLEFEQAEYFEKKLKKWSRAKKIALAEQKFDLLPILAECKNGTHSKFND